MDRRRPLGQPRLRHRASSRSATSPSRWWPRSASSPAAPATGSGRSSSATTAPSSSRRAAVVRRCSRCCTRSTASRVPTSPARRPATCAARCARWPSSRVAAVSWSSSPTSSTNSEWQPPLRALAVRHDVLAVEILDPREIELPPVGLVTLVDTETGRRVEVQTASEKVRARFAEAAARSNVPGSRATSAVPAPSTWCCAPTVTGSSISPST